MAHRNNIVPAATIEVRSNRQKYRATAPEQVLDMARLGMFPEEWCAELGISIRTLYSWANDKPEFEEAVEQAWHILHAYWARLLRENITNPAFRQSAALHVMAKRFPATWGQNPRNTLEHFDARNEKSAVSGGAPECPRCAELKRMTSDEIRARIATLEDRRKHDQ